MQYGQPVLYALVNPQQPSEERMIICRGTGHPVADEEAKGLKYLSTIHLMNDSLMFHFWGLKAQSCAS